MLKSYFYPCSKHHKQDKGHYNWFSTGKCANPCGQGIRIYNQKRYGFARQPRAEWYNLINLLVLLLISNIAHFVISLYTKLKIKFKNKIK